tara:strand:- start:87 stop:1889 length:1803 start_codon:yes stop_codon:yes gene_type:complete
MAKKKKPLIKYTSRDFDSIKTDLVEHAQRYYPDSYRDFNEASVGSFLLDTVAYVGDILSFYLDYSVNESFLSTANEYGNVIKHGQSMGYTYDMAKSSFGVCTFFIVVPANSTGLGPDSRYIPTLKKGTLLRSSAGVPFTLTEDVMFNRNDNEIVAARMEASTGIPSYYAIKAYGQVMSGELKSESIDIGAFQRFRRVLLNATNVTEILSVTDLEGHEYYEVPHLSQDVIYRDILTRGTDRDYAARILKPFIVKRRFTVDRGISRTALQFGTATDDERSAPSIAEPTSITLKRHGKDYISDTTFDPSKITETDSLGIAPENTTLIVTYRTNSNNNVNAAVGSIDTVGNSVIEFDNPSSVNPGLANEVRGSLEVTNDMNISGDSSGMPSLSELKTRISSYYAAQDRAVTKQDYEALVYAMPAKYGSIKRCLVHRDPDSMKRNLNLYVVSEDENGNFTTTNNIVKQNLKTWLNDKRMINDTIDVLDAKIANIGINFTIVANDNLNRFDILRNATERVKRKFATEKMLLSEPLYISEIYNELNKTRGVVDVKDVQIVRKIGAIYSDDGFNLQDNTSADGRYIDPPDNVVMEIRFPDLDVKGTIG